MTSAAVPDVSGADALVPPAAQIGGGSVPRSTSAQPRNSTVCGLNSVTPPELSAVMLLSSQPPGTRFVLYPLVCLYTW
jgi:hypothetical protein